MSVRKNLFTRFADWVDSKGKDAWDWLVLGALIGGFALGAACFFGGVIFSSYTVVSIGGILIVLNLALALAVG